MMDARRRSVALRVDGARGRRPRDRDDD